MTLFHTRIVFESGYEYSTVLGFKGMLGIGTFNYQAKGLEVENIIGVTRG